jgi:hypothetical protein
MSAGERTPYAQVTPIVEALIARLTPFCEMITAAGSYRRERQTIGDLEIVAIPGEHLHAELDKMVETGEIQKSPLRSGWGKKQRKFDYQGFKIDLYMCDQDNAGYILWVRTGNNDGGDGNARVLSYINRCRERGYDKPQFELHDGYVWHRGVKLHIPDETTFYALLGLPVIPPGERCNATYERLFKRKEHRWGDHVPCLPNEPEHIAPEGEATQADLFGGASGVGYDAEDGGRRRYSPAQWRLIYESWAEQGQRIADRIADPAKRAIYQSFADKWRAKAAAAGNL